MASVSLQNWKLVRKSALDELEAAHRGIGGSRRGRRYATIHINQAYAVLLSSQFQGFCRDLHSECIEHLVRPMANATLQAIVRNLLVQNRKLDSGNPNPGNIGNDFNRFGFAFWDEVKSLDLRNETRLARLEELNLWRNAIAHQNFDQVRLRGRTILRLGQVRKWRDACNHLSSAFDEVMRLHLFEINGVYPW